ncbi:SUKH-4 family immunity protein [Streptomyces sp. BE230]|uniref:SUKH-4 family immunity protein n=1 Tax=Streptomyces sp. BE230 TaxID=3002526 RepID=UPI002ED283F7|nr:SUKH-4 family immunity protein [Streptomyces sp. BE230]
MSNESGSGRDSEFAMVPLSFDESEKVMPESYSLEVPTGPIGSLYRCLDFLEYVTVGARGKFIKFGTTGLFGSVLFDPETGQVVESGRGIESVRVVNTTLECFSLCVRGVMRMYPFIVNESHDWEAVGDEVEVLVRRIDPEAYEVPNNLWYEFKWSIVSEEWA